jgi:hypothetical protein
MIDSAGAVQLSQGELHQVSNRFFDRFRVSVTFAKLVSALLLVVVAACVMDAEAAHPTKQAKLSCAEFRNLSGGQPLNGIWQRHQLIVENLVVFAHKNIVLAQSVSVQGEPVLKERRKQYQKRRYEECLMSLQGKNFSDSVKERICRYGHFLVFGLIGFICGLAVSIVYFFIDFVLIMRRRKRAESGDQR